jgi:putative acetyltransferase
VEDAASLLFGHINTEARRMGFARLSLETGPAAYLQPARSRYEKFGFEYCEAFGSYRPGPHNVVMTRRL